jgi:metal-responsive CopG/Arc/MetJ family transcriptional regulator
MSTKHRLSVSVDADLIDAMGKLVARGHSNSISAWVNEALRSKLAHDRGEITHEEMALAARRARSSAVVVRGNERGRRLRSAKRRSAR